MRFQSCAKLAIGLGKNQGGVMMMRVCVDMDMSGQSGQKGSLTQRLTALAGLGHRDLPTSVSPHVRPKLLNVHSPSCLSTTATPLSTCIIPSPVSHQLSGLQLLHKNDSAVFISLTPDLKNPGVFRLRLVLPRPRPDLQTLDPSNG